MERLADRANVSRGIFRASFTAETGIRRRRRWSGCGSRWRQHTCRRAANRSRAIADRRGLWRCRTHAPRLHAHLWSSAAVVAASAGSSGRPATARRAQVAHRLENSPFQKSTLAVFAPCPAPTKEARRFRRRRSSRSTAPWRSCGPFCARSKAVRAESRKVVKGMTICSRSGGPTQQCGEAKHSVKAPSASRCECRPIRD